ncbi:hypothetical protein Afil01_36180 [Actinorhabdospora filicis]|uniref:Golgi phosphoprotein 3 (GPP34) n=1 Tax=Actinorhabdospora filicis TaxID=1785913 RepID=A0A9W6SMW7_9ACTN|nr:GPP34 family phosphoprotein [Actinorhabdospora filicis]GLZ78811.1 hypothetical protein Afil01_36180 [Actinorhabdospora filicis]
MRTLRLADELLLIAYDDDTGRNRATGLELGLAGSLLLELALSERLRVDGRKKVHVVSAASIGDEFADEALARVGADKPRTARSWVNTFSRKLLPRVRERLVGEGVLREEVHKVFGLFPYRYYPLADGRGEGEARARLERAAGNGVAGDARTAALAGLIRATSLERRALPGLSSWEARRVVKGLAEAGWAGEATREAIAATQMAVIAAVTASVAASTAATSGG